MHKNRITNLGESEEAEDAATRNFVYRRFQKIVVDYDLDKIADKWRETSDNIAQLQDNITANRKVIQTNQDEIVKSLANVEETVKGKLSDEIVEAFTNIKNLISALNDNLIDNDGLQDELNKIVNQFRARYDDFNAKLEVEINAIKEDLGDQKKWTRRKIDKELQDSLDGITTKADSAVEKSEQALVRANQAVSDANSDKNELSNYYTKVEVDGLGTSLTKEVKQNTLQLTGGQMWGDIDMDTHQITIKKPLLEDYNVVNNFALKVISCMYGEWPPAFIYRPASGLSHYNVYEKLLLKNYDDRFFIDAHTGNRNSLLFEISTTHTDVVSGHIRCRRDNSDTINFGFLLPKRETKPRLLNVTIDITTSSGIRPVIEQNLELKDDIGASIFLLFNSGIITVYPTTGKYYEILSDAWDFETVLGDYLAKGVLHVEVSNNIRELNRLMFR